MSTRGIMGFRAHGTDKVTYNHSDSYPECLGATMIEWAREKAEDELAAIADNIFLVSENAPVQSWLAQWAIQSGIADRDTHDMYDLFRDQQGHPEYWDLALDGPFFMIDSRDFLTDSLYCEWGYILNVDTKKLEVWRGFQTTPDPSNRYGTNGQGSYDPSTTYYPCACVLEIPFGTLRTQPVEKLVQQMNDAANTKRR